ncbi:MAG: hypothetical protein Q9173_005305 [Seirophora scorigena]
MSTQGADVLPPTSLFGTVEDRFKAILADLFDLAFEQDDPDQVFHTFVDRCNNRVRSATDWQTWREWTNPIDDAFSETGLIRAPDLLAAMRSQYLDRFDRLLEDTPSHCEVTSDGYMRCGLELLPALEKCRQSKPLDRFYGMLLSAKFVVWYEDLKEEAKKMVSPVQQYFKANGLAIIRGRG